MFDFQSLIQSGSASVWLYIPVAILLGALHGLEPGHSKTMMAAFIIAVRGTIWQAVLLGVSAAFSHSLIIWLLAALALSWGSAWNVEETEPYFQLASAVMIAGLALWMFVRTRREVREAEAHAQAQAHGHSHGHGHAHDHREADHSKPAQVQSPPPPAPAPKLLVQAANEISLLSTPDTVIRHEVLPDGDHSHSHTHSHSHGHSHGAPAILHVGERITPGGLILPGNLAMPESLEPVVTSPSAPPSRVSRQGLHGGMLLDTGHGWLEVSLFKSGGLSRFRIYPCKASGQAIPLPKGTQLGIETARIDGSSQKFAFVARDGYWESTTDLPAPHEFLAIVTLGHSDHAHTYRLRFTDDAKRPADVPAMVEEPAEGDDVYEDAHERAHAEDIAKRFANRHVTTPQIVLFGLTGGLMPCPAAFTVLLVCLQVKRATLGFALVAAFSFGLALTMVTVGAVAAWSVHHAQKRFKGFGDWMRRAPFISCAVLLVLAAYMAWHGWQGLVHGHAH